MTNTRKANFDGMIAGAQRSGKNEIFELPSTLVDVVSGANDFYQGSSFAQNFSCFAQNIGDFSQGTPPSNHQHS